MGSHHPSMTLQGLRPTGDVSNELTLQVLARLLRKRCPLALRALLGHKFSLLLIQKYSKLEVMWHGDVPSEAHGRGRQCPQVTPMLQTARARVSSEGVGSKICLKERPAKAEGSIANE